MTENKEVYENLIQRDSEFQVDTIPETRGVNGWFTHDDNTVTISYKDGYTRKDSLPHEQKHKDNYNAGIYEYPVSPEQAYKLNMYNEISANIASLLELRQKYLETGDISVFDYNKNDNRYLFYKEAIQKGLIDPASPYQEDFDKEMSLIATGTKNMWLETFGVSYDGQSWSCASHYGERDGSHAEYYEQNYNRAKKIALTMGGVDFNQYMDKEIEIPQKGKEKLPLLSNADNAKLAQEKNLPAYDGTISLEQYQKLLYHKIVLDKYLNSNSALSAEEMKDQIALMQIAGTRETGKVKNACDRACEQTKQSYRHMYNKISENDKLLISSLVNLAAHDYQKQGKELPRDNDKAYREAVKNIYTFDYHSQGDISYNGSINLQKVLDCEEQISKNNELPAYARSVKNMSSKERNFRKYMNFMGVPEKQINNSINNLKGKNQALQILGAGSVAVFAPIAGCYNWIKNKVSSGKKKNEKTHEIEKDKKPVYRQWKDKDGSRVSDVQYEKILDLSKPILKRPTKSRAAAAKKVSGNSGTDNQAKHTPSSTKPQTNTAQAAKPALQAQQAAKQTAQQNTSPSTQNKNNEEKMLAIINYMNKINGANKAVDAAKAVKALTSVYGDEALSLLQTAVNEPGNYAKYVNNSSIKTSREALLHLCNSADAKKTAEVVKTRQVSTTKIEIKEQLKKDNEQQKKTQNAQSIKSQMRADTNTRVKASETQKQNLTHPNDATYVQKQQPLNQIKVKPGEIQR